jgi:hypothetical protein
MSDAAIFALIILFALMLSFVVVAFACYQDGPSEETEQKARKLLTKWLSPAQLAQYERKGISK